MNKEIDINELSEILKRLDLLMPLDVLIRSKLSGGWVTIQGKAFIEENTNLKNSIDIKISDRETKEGNIIRIVGSKSKKFNISLSPSHYKEIKRHGINIDMIKIDDTSCKFKIDDSIIFSINRNEHEIEKLIFK
ncbi:hypothetical protein [Clostridium sp. BJN0001]|uniref:hypothetical protein n=1 Tax=Clostridium sp. BJN0001 TaxID=2930219 RepID=UPI001FD01615|nr:hypothetical protein [Clostridium sp. BJN0001]